MNTVEFWGKTWHKDFLRFQLFKIKAAASQLSNGTLDPMSLEGLPVTLHVLN
ncbi:hypothetical protein D3C77_504920 [compost metagenome]|uniref:hypothetical protein n=1 Tax=Pseudomonas sp. S12(2018) TaxID=2219664 RepID=UPI000FA29560|nr:hypothetical protein [Pseudomonas sp. S12(2018)]